MGLHSERTTRGKGQRVAAIAGGLALGASSLSLAGASAGSGVAGASVAVSSGHTLTITKLHIAKVGTVLTTSKGLTLYRYTVDPTGKATCTGPCAKVWPPVLVPKGEKIKAPHGLKGFSAIRLSNGKRQLEFHGQALYRFAGDKHKGSAAGQGVEGTWFAEVASNRVTTASPTTSTSPAAAPTPATPATSPSATSPSATTTTKAPAPVKSVTTTTKASSPAPTSPPATTPTTAPKPPPTTTTPPPPTTTTTAPPTGGVGF
jgi:predicted lipoprotein with Yx(FWY)xxD motif